MLAGFGSAAGEQPRLSTCLRPMQKNALGSIKSRMKIPTRIDERKTA